MSFLSASSTAAWVASGVPDWRRFRAALAEPAEAQRACWEEARAVSEGTPAYPGRIEDVPPHGYDALQPFVERAAAGEHRVLTREHIERFEPSSGSTAAAKLVPSTPLFRRQYQRAIHAWVVQMYREKPAIGLGRAYWSISPALAARRTAGGHPIGFDEDTAYLGGWQKAVVDRVMAVPGSVRSLAGDAFLRATVLSLLATADLSFVSVWSPTFLTTLLDWDDAHHDELRRDLRDGVEILGRRLRRAVPEDPWPRLGLVSCWTDAQAAAQLPELERRLPSVPLAPKGLLATEAFVSLPWEGRRPVAVTAHVIELERDDGSLAPVTAWREGEAGNVVVTTAGGLVRYRLGDRVEVTGFVERTPTIRLLGRADRVSDLCGEKINEAFVAGILEELGVGGFAMLAPEGRGYTLFAEDPPPLAALEAALARNPHYRWAVEVGQLRSVEAVRVSGRPWDAWHAAMAARGIRLGDIKPTALDRASDWAARLPGERVRS